MEFFFDDKGKNKKNIVPRAEEIIAEIYRLMVEKKSEGIIPQRVILPFKFWKAVRIYKKSIGIINGPVPDYLSENGIFNLEVWYENPNTESPNIVVE